jgi:glutathione-specific gamma-glutamylcyclotransferase
MWIFGYGSLMWDGWETGRACLRRAAAELPGYARILNKLSVSNWGTEANPGPTLNLIAGDSSCQGVAFEFDEAARADILAYITQREGKGFALKELPIVLQGGVEATALVPLYQGRNIIRATGTAEIAAMALKAKGTSGNCASYTEGVAEQLRKLGIADPAVAEMHRALLAAK